MRLLALLLLAAPALASADPGPSRRVAVVFDAADADQRETFVKVARALGAGATVSRFELGESSFSDPIAKGRLLADLQARDLVVPVGDGAAQFVAEELEDASVYFVGVRTLPGAALSAPGVRGEFAYSVETLLDAAKALRFERIGLAFTPGYEPVAGWVRRGAAARGLTLVERRVNALKDVAPAGRELFSRASAVWLVGDPLIVRGAGFEFLREGSLSSSVPLIMPGPWGVRHGGLLAHEGAPEALSVQASSSVAVLLGGGDGPKLQPAPRGGTLLLNAALAEKWKVTPAEGLRWQMIR